MRKRLRTKAKRLRFDYYIEQKMWRYAFWECVCSLYGLDPLDNGEDDPYDPLSGLPGGEPVGDDG